MGAEGRPTYTLHHLSVFVAVADTGSITAGASRLHMSPSAVSASITDLERRLGVRLCVRRRAKGVHLTATGEGVLDHARTVLHHAGELQYGARGESGAVGPVRVGCYPSLGPTLLPVIIHTFTRAHPRASVDLREADQDALRIHVDRGQLDLAFVYGIDAPTEWRLEVLLTRRPMVVLPGEHRLAAGDPSAGVDLADLADEPMILLDAPPSAAHARAVCAQAGFAPKVAYRTANYETARAFVGRGFGWTLLLQRPHGDTTYEGFTVAVRPIATPEVAEIGVCLAWREGVPLSHPARAFIAAAKQVLSSGS